MPSLAALTASLAVVSSVLAGPTETIKQKPRQVQLPPVTASGNSTNALTPASRRPYPR